MNFKSIFCLLLLNPLFLLGKQDFVVGRLNCQLGNNMFQIAATSALAWDHGATPYFPDLSTKLTEGMPVNYEHVFFRCNATFPPLIPSVSWKFPVEHNFSSCIIPYIPNMQVGAGTFQSESYFAHHRQRIIELFAPRSDDLAYIQEKYGAILDQPNTVSVQIRWFGVSEDEPWFKYLAQYGYDYFDKAMSLFPKESLFIISTNNIEFARLNIPDWAENVLFLEDEPHYIDFYVLSLCKNHVISNSTFGWWAAWLSQNPNKIVVVPEHWVDPEWHFLTPVVDVYPESWLKIQAKMGKPFHSMTSFR